jgi:acyl-coenzyme A synthetase/AMP-(fatty) acid ligase
LQVKIRGFRIELGEIEQKLLSISNFKEGCVIVVVDTLCCMFDI